jgi:hypothetical protein
VDLAAAPASFTVTGTGFRNAGFGLPWVNFTRGGQLIGQARAIAMVGSTSLTVPFPTDATTANPGIPGLSPGPVTVFVYNQTASDHTAAASYVLVGSTSLTVMPPSVTAIAPSPVDLASPPASFTVTGTGFRNAGFGLPWVNFTRGGQLIGQARAVTMAGSTSLTVPFPTDATTANPGIPGLSPGPVTVFVYNQTASDQTTAASYALVGSTSLTLVLPSVAAITSTPVDLAALPTIGIDDQ